MFLQKEKHHETDEYDPPGIIADVERDKLGRDSSADIGTYYYTYALR